MVRIFFQTSDLSLSLLLFVSLRVLMCVLLGLVPCALGWVGAERVCLRVSGACDECSLSACLFPAVFPAGTPPPPPLCFVNVRKPCIFFSVVVVVFPGMQKPASMLVL